VSFVSPWFPIKDLQKAPRNGPASSPASILAMFECIPRYLYILPNLTDGVVQKLTLWVFDSVFPGSSVIRKPSAYTGRRVLLSGWTSFVSRCYLKWVKIL